MRCYTQRRKELMNEQEDIEEQFYQSLSTKQKKNLLKYFKQKEKEERKKEEREKERTKRERERERP